MVVECLKEIVIWGAGRAAEKNYRWAAFAGYHIIFFVDNDSEKWGRVIQGIPVHSPKILEGYKSTILVSDSYKEEIENQLSEISYQGRILGFEQFKKEAVSSKDINIDLSKVRVGNKTSFIFDSYFTGSNWGGIESWSCIVANQLICLGMETQVICGQNKKFDECTKNCLHFSGTDELKLIKEMTIKIAEFLPCVFLTHCSVALYAAQIVKSFFPDQIKLIAVAHGDEINTYERFQFWSDRLDKIICISQKIIAEFRDRYKVATDKLIYHPNPIYVQHQVVRRISNDGILRIGFAARLTERQKRVHLLPAIIEECIKRKLNVEFNIAGEGEAKDRLVEYVNSRKLQHTVHILGWISPEKMADFWKEQDVYLNISDFEGMSLAMLESMACGVVPIVTDVSGVSDLIEDGKNGFVVPVDSWLETVDKIENLSRNRERLQRAGDYNMTLIREKCSLEDYAEWLVREFCI